MLHSKPDSLILILFGASGDLAKRKLISAIYNLYFEDLLPSNFAVLGLTRRLTSRKEFQDWMKDGVEKYGEIQDDETWNKFASKLYHLKADIYDNKSFTELLQILHTINTEQKCQGNLLYYLATAPSNFNKIIWELHEKNLLNGLFKESWGRIIVEKPFGIDLDSAIELNRLMKSYLDENQIFRIDHYLGKEAVQNLLVFRFANMLFNPVWNRKFIDHIQITVCETVGLDKRADYFEQTGNLRDMVQSHLLQIVAFLTMERPTSLDPDAIRDKKLELLRCIKRISPEKVNEYTVRGQYKEGQVFTSRSGDHKVVAYRDEDGVDKNSTVETFVALKLEIENDRWDGVPIYLRTGKRMRKRLSEVVIEFKAEKFGIFRDKEAKMESNRLILRIQPNPSINIKMGWKPPGLLSDVTPLSLDFQGKPEWELEPRAYERLLLDAMLNDKTLFIRFDEVEEQWRVLMPILKGWEKSPVTEPFANYEAGSDGPQSSFEFIERDGRKWNPIS